MSTNCRIGYQTEDGKYDSIYCHWDGYETYVGALLIKSYTTIERIKELLSYGDASSIDAVMEDCVFYHRDRDEDWDAVKPKILDFEDVRHIIQEYNYCFIDGVWYCFTNDISDKYDVKTFLEKDSK